MSIQGSTAAPRKFHKNSDNFSENDPSGKLVIFNSIAIPRRMEIWKKM